MFAWLVRFSRFIAVALLLGCSGSSSLQAPTAPVLDVPPLDGGGGASSDLPPNTVRFGRAPPVVGARWRVDLTAGSNLPDPKNLRTQTDSYDSSYEVEVLATNGAAPSRVRLTFLVNDYYDERLGRRVPTSLDGKTYVVESVAPLVRNAAGGAVPSEQADRVLDIFSELGTRTQIDQVLPEAPIAIGEERNELAGAVLRLLHPRNWTLDGGTARLSRVDGEDAVFALKIEATARSGVRMSVDGEARVRIRDARLTSLVVKGTVPGTDGDPDGTVSIRRETHDL